MLISAAVLGWLKVKALYGLFIKDCFAYPAASFIWVIADAQSAVILPAVLLAAPGPGQMVGTMNQADLASYYLVSMTLAQFIVCHLMWDLAWEIREGTFTIYLVRPYSYFWTCLVRNFAWRSTKLSLFMPIFALAMLVYGPYARDTTLHFGFDLVAVAILAQTLSFAAGYCLAILTFWTTEFISAFRIYYIPEMFFSGRLLPISLMPAWTIAVGTGCGSSTPSLSQSRWCSAS